MASFDQFIRPGDHQELSGLNPHSVEFGDYNVTDYLPIGEMQVLADVLGVQKDAFSVVTEDAMRVREMYPDFDDPAQIDDILTEIHGLTARMPVVDLTEEMVDRYKCDGTVPLDEVVIPDYSNPWTKAMKRRRKVIDKAGSSEV